MKNNGIEDILIGGGYNTKKKKSKGFLVVIFLLLLIFAGFVCAYFYLTSSEEISSKEMFITNISKVNAKGLLQNNLYNTTLEKIEEKDFKTDTTINISTTLEDEEVKDIDLSKFTLELSNVNDVENSKSFSEAVLNYSDNKIFELKMLTNENMIALASSEVHDKYVGCSFENLEETLDISYNHESIQNLKNSEDIDITEEENDKYIKKYFSEIMNNIPEEKFSIQENLAIQKNAENIDVTAYTVKLNQDEVNELVKKILTMLKDDTELLNEIAGVANEESGEDNENTNNIVEQEIVNTEENIVENADEQLPENGNSEVETEPTEEVEEPVTEENITEESVPEEPVADEPEIPVITINPVGNIDTVNMTQEQKEIYPETEENDSSVLDINSLTNSEDEFNSNMTSIQNNFSKVIEMIQYLAWGKKLNMTVNELQDLIDNRIQLNDYYETSGNLEGNGLSVTVYASKENVEKISMTFPNDTTLDLEFIKNSENDNQIKITYLYKENMSKASYMYRYEGKTEDEISETDSSEYVEVTNGFSWDYSKIQKDANTTINLTYNYIENEKITRKTILDLKTEGTVNSKQLINDIILTTSTSEDETKIMIDNKITFEDVEESEIEELTQENCLYLDQLPEEELATTLTDLENKVTNLYNNKKENLDFIDTNTGGSVSLDSVSSNVSREEAKNALITRVSNMMQEAIDNNQEFTIQNLVDLKIDGYEVSSTVTENNAVIVVDLYTFNIDTNFTLTDVE